MECAHCGEKVAKRDAKETGAGELVCPDCADDMTECAECDALFDHGEDEAVTLCEDCRPEDEDGEPEDEDEALERPVDDIVRELCATDAERLDVKNGLLLAAHLDAAFDAGLIDFDDAGQIRFAERFAPADRLAAGLHDVMALAKLTPEHGTFLAWRRAHLLAASG